jgi:hypothetical protein
MLFTTKAKSKASGHMISAFKALLKQMPAYPARIFSDKGLEFLAAPVKEFLKSLGIKQLQAESPEVKAAVAERAIQNIKKRLYKYFTDREEKRWVDVLPLITRAINHSHCTAIGMRPVDVNFNNAMRVRDKVYGPPPRSPAYFKTKPTKFEPGDKVRIAKEKKTFEKSYLPNYTKEVFEISKIVSGKPTTYRIKTADKENVTGHFYDPELSRTKYDLDRKLVIREVLKQRVRRGLRQYLVAFKGRPDDEAVWITEADLV